MCGESYSVSGGYIYRACAFVCVHAGASCSIPDASRKPLLSHAEGHGPCTSSGWRQLMRREELTCLGCHKRECPLERRACLPDLDVEVVLEAIRDVGRE